MVISPCVYSDPQTRELRLDLDRLIHPWCDKTAATESSGPAGKAGRPPPSSPGRGRLPPGSGTQSTFQTAHVRCAAARPAGWEAEAGHLSLIHILCKKAVWPRNAVLLVFSLVFYAWGELSYFWLLDVYKRQGVHRAARLVEDFEDRLLRLHAGGFRKGRCG